MDDRRWTMVGCLSSIVHRPSSSYGEIPMAEQRPSLSQQAYEAIKRKIVSLELPPGALIDESALREELGIGRTPIREALQRLSLEKLVVIHPRRGTFVSDVRLADLQRLTELRLTLEALAMRLAAQRGTEEHWQRMALVLAQAPWDKTDTDNEEWICVDQKCHEIAYEATDNPYLRDILTMLYAHSLRLWYIALREIGDMRQAIREHEHILEALRAGDGDRAAQLMQRHILAFHEQIQATMLAVSL